MHSQVKSWLRQEKEQFGALLTEIICNPPAHKGAKLVREIPYLPEPTDFVGPPLPGKKASAWGWKRYPKSAGRPLQFPCIEDAQAHAIFMGCGRVVPIFK